MKAWTFFFLKCLALVTAEIFPSQQPWNPPQRNHDNMCQGRMDGILFPDPESCDVYVQCQRGVAVLQRCERGTLFDLNLFYCVATHSVDCGSRRHPNIIISPIQPPTRPEIPPTSESHHSVCRNVRNGAMIANPNNCRAYIECQQNLRLDRECGSGELFEARSGVCLSDFTVDCGDRSSAPPLDDGSNRNVCAGQRNGNRVASPLGCGRYFECQNGQAFDLQCDPGQLYEVRLSMCISAAAVNCAGRGAGVNTQTPQLDVDGNISRFICSGLPGGTRISNPQDCRMYYECRNNQRIDLTCPAGQSFELTTNSCQASHLVTCGTRRNTQIDPQQNAICQGQRNGRRFGNPLNCRAFIECQSNVRVDRVCDTGLLFDAQLENCLPAHIVRCGSRGLPPSNEPQSPDDFFPPCPRNGFSFRSHPHDCQRYFICVEGTLIQHSCAAGIHFNPTSLQCDFPQNAHCRSQRVVVPQTPILPDCSTGQDFFPNLVNCKQYFICVNKMPQVMDCPENFVWDNQKLRCVFSESDACARSYLVG